jgi:hypothetical protein
MMLAGQQTLRLDVTFFSPEKLKDSNDVIKLVGDTARIGLISQEQRVDINNQHQLTR